MFTAEHKNENTFEDILKEIRMAGDLTRGGRGKICCCIACM